MTVHRQHFSDQAFAFSDRTGAKQRAQFVIFLLQELQTLQLTVLQ